MIDTSLLHEMKDKMQTFNISNYQAVICKNIKRIRRELFDEYKYQTNAHSSQNPYSAIMVAELLGISHEYYKRLESFDKNKPISLKLFLKITVLFDKEIAEFFKE